MTTGAEICRIVLDETSPLIEAVFDQIGLGERAGDALLNKLCRDGVVARKGDRLTVGWNKKAARELADQVTSTAPPEHTQLRPMTGAPFEINGSDKPARAKPRALPVPAKIEIRTDIPCPPARMGKVARIIPWPFAEMRPGHSFTVAVPEGFTAKEVAKALYLDAAAYRKRESPGFRVAIRIAEDQKSVGVWREADLTAVSNVIAGEKATSSLGIRARRSRKANAAGAVK